MSNLLEQALAARRGSRRVALRMEFDPDSRESWRELIRDVAALANSGGGVTLIGKRIEAFQVSETLREYADTDFADLEIVEATRDDKPVVALLVGEATTPIVFTNREIGKGVVYVRHGAKSVAATTQDLAAIIDRRVQMVRRSWLTAVKHVVQGSAILPLGVLPPEIRDSDSPEATPIRVVEDPNAPAFRLMDFDKSHPFRQKEVLAELRDRLPGIALNAFDLLAVRKVFHIDDNADFSHQTKFGTRQYSPKFVEWLVAQGQKDPEFFQNVRRRFGRRQ